jgi:hypothetical protein
LGEKPVEERLAILETKLEEHQRLEGHEGIVRRMATLETRHAVLETKVAIYSALGAVVGSIAVNVFMRLLNL